MIKMNIPYAFIKYTRLFLSARRTTVEINGTRSKEFYLNQGLPQGSAISPLLFLLFINDISCLREPHRASLQMTQQRLWNTAKIKRRQ